MAKEYIKEIPNWELDYLKEDGLAFYEFPEITDKKTFKDSIEEFLIL